MACIRGGGGGGRTGAGCVYVCALNGVGVNTMRKEIITDRHKLF